MKEAIQKAIEGGWKNEDYLWLSKDLVGDDDLKKAIAELVYDTHFWLLDPLFWQSLGEATGNGLNNNPDNIYGKTGEIIFWWLYHWHRFIDHIAAGGSEDEFFNQLLK